MINPFEFSGDVLVHLSSGAVANTDTTSDMKNMLAKGESAAMSFMKLQIVGDNPDIYTKIKRMELKTFCSNLLNVNRKNTKGQMVTLKYSKALFARMLLIAQSRQLNIDEVLTYSLTPYPNPLATNDGSLVKTVKAKLLAAKEAEGVDCHEASTGNEKAYRLNGMAILQTLSAIPNTFYELAIHLLVKVVSLAVFTNAGRVDFVCDRYPVHSIKNLEKEKRAFRGNQKMHICNEQQCVAREWKKFLSSGENKEELMKFIFKIWQKANSKLLKGVDVFLAHENICHRLTESNGAIECTEVEELFATTKKGIPA
eukprot:gene20801-22841_t